MKKNLLIPLIRRSFSKGGSLPYEISLRFFAPFALLAVFGFLRAPHAAANITIIPLSDTEKYPAQVSPIPPASPSIFSNGKIQLTAAGNETVAFQLLLKSDTPQEK